MKSPLTARKALCAGSSPPDCISLVGGGLHHPSTSTSSSSSPILVHTVGGGGQNDQECGHKTMSPSSPSHRSRPLLIFSTSPDLPALAMPPLHRLSLRGQENARRDQKKPNHIHRKNDRNDSENSVRTNLKLNQKKNSSQTHPPSSGSTFTLDEEEDEIFESQQALLLSSSYKMPSPSTKKGVRWADGGVGGIGLSSCRKFSSEDEPRCCAKSPINGNSEPDCNPTPGNLALNSMPSTERLPSFSQNNLSLPSPESIAACVRAHHVHLESMVLRMPRVFLTVRCLNMSFEKAVSIRVTFDEWRSFADVPALFLASAPDSMTDQFHATLEIPSGCTQAQFAVRYLCPKGEFWDSNGNANYKLTFLLD